MLQYFAKETRHCTLVLPTQHKNVDDITVLVDRAPEVVPLPANLHHYLIHEPRVAELAATFAEVVRIIGTEFCTPQPNRLVGNGNAAFGQQILDVAKAQLKTVVILNGATDDLRREPVASIDVVYASIVPD